MKSNIQLSKRIFVPPFQWRLWIVVAEKVVPARNKIFPVCVDWSDQREKCGVYIESRNGNGLFFKAGPTLTHGTIAHEIFHATHYMLNWAGDKFSHKHQEPYAWLADWLTDQVYTQLKKARIRVR